LIPRLVVASKNPDKLREIGAVLEWTGLAGELVTGLDWPEVEETGETLEENALLKARAVVGATGLPALGDDTGLEVAALDGAPGVRSSRFAGPDASYADNVALLLRMLEGVDDRSARFRTVMALVFPHGVEVTTEGTLAGMIAETPRGSGGFGYDPVFLVGERTLAELPTEEKNELSHRARAIRALAVELGLEGQ
jgi:XTP/dITP diphosphohydrolase